MAVTQAAAVRRAVAAAESLGTAQARRLGDIRVDSYFQYSIAYTFTLGSENFNNVIQILSDAHFLCMSTSYTNSVEVGSTSAVPPVGIGYNKLSVVNGGAVIQLTDGGTQRQLQNIQVPVNTLFGSGELPHIWEFTHLFRANTQIGINITGMAAAAPFAGQVIRLVFSGMKVPVNTLTSLGL